MMRNVGSAVYGRVLKVRRKEKEKRLGGRKSNLDFSPRMLIWKKGGQYKEGKTRPTSRR